MTFDDWCARYGDYLNDSDDAAKAARLMAWRAWDAADRERSDLRARAERAEAERDALRAALELYRGQVDQTGRHSAADAIKLAIRQGK